MKNTTLLIMAAGIAHASAEESSNWSRWDYMMRLLWTIPSMMPSKPDLTRVCKFNCCYGCETYTVPANISLRIYSKIMINIGMLISGSIFNWDC